MKKNKTTSGKMLLLSEKEMKRTLGAKKKAAKRKAPARVINIADEIQLAL